MLVSENFKRRYSAYLKTRLPEIIFHNPEFEASLREDIEGLVKLSTEAVCVARKKGLALQCDLSDLAERVIKLSDGNEVIAGARFKNLDPKFPFVEVQKGFEVSPAILAELKTCVIREFKTLKPLGLKFDDKPGLHSTLAKWSHTVFGPIQTTPAQEKPSELQFNFSSELSWFEQYFLEYQERLTEMKELRGFVSIGTKDEFEEAAADNALLLLSDSQGFAGVVAGINSPLYGLPALYMIESYLSKRWVGQKLAPRVHSYFLNELAKNFSYVWGTIYDKNLSSLATAQRIGRKIIETEYFLRFD